MEREHYHPDAARVSDAAGAGQGLVAPEPSEDEVAWLARILAVVRQRSGLDFSGYRFATLVRRVRNRTIAANARTFAEYFERLDGDAGEETRALVATLTIKVSRFFRDPETFEALRRALQARRTLDPGRRLSVWSAGCGRGEEPYGLAILLSQLEPPALDSDVLGTDIDAGALDQAAVGCYPPASLAGLDLVLRDRYFHERAAPNGMVYCVRPAPRARVAFLRHDLVGSPTAPEGRRYDLVCCRNVLIYLQGEAQLRVFALLAAGLRPGGLLCLGEAEWLLPPLVPAFDVVDPRARLFRLREALAEATA